MINIADNLQFDDFKRAKKSEQIAFFQELNSINEARYCAADVKALIGADILPTPRRNGSISIFKFDPQQSGDQAQLMGFIEKFINAARSKRLLTRMVAKKWLNFFNSLSDNDEVMVGIDCGKEKASLISALFNRDAKSCAEAFSKLKTTSLKICVTRQNGEMIEQNFKRDTCGNITIPSFVNALGI